MKKLNLLIVTILSIGLVACTNESDSPVINSLTIQDNIKIEEDANLNIEYDFSDDNGLKKYNVSILDDFEDARLQSAIWDYDVNFNLSGTSSNDVNLIPLPYNDIEPGQYELTITVQDIDGNEVSESKSFVLYLDI